MATADPTVDAPPAPRAGARPELPDTALFWRWVARATRPVWGWTILGVGFILVIVGYLGVSREALVAKQLPYLISGGIGGITLVVFGAMLIGSEDLKRASERIDRLERMVGDLHAALLARPDAPALGNVRSANGEAAPAVDAGRLLALPDGQSYHRPGCTMIQGKSQAETVTASVARRRGLKPCRLCEPEPAASTV
jgi:hypothetical protein